MRLTKKVIALLLCALMVATVLPVGVFAADESTYSVGEVNLNFDFEGDTSWVSTYFNNHKGSSPVTYNGTADASSSKIWGNYVKEENGNTYSYAAKAAGNGYAIRNASGYDNFGGLVRLSFRARFNSLSNTATSGLYFPVVRLGNSKNPYGGTTDFANLVALGNASSFPGEAAKTDGTKNLIGYLYAGSDGGTSFNQNGLAAYSDTWYDFDMIFNKATGKYWLIITDGTAKYETNGTNSVLSGLDILNQILLFRSFSTNSVAVGFDDLHLTNVLPNFGTLGTDMSDLQYAVVEEEQAAHASSNPYFMGFTSQGSANANWNLITETEGGRDQQVYFSH